MSHTQTDNADLDGPAGEPPVPGALLVYRGHTACCHVLPLRGGALTLGRESTAALSGADSRMSRAHAEVRLDGPGWMVRDLGSRNGSFLDGSQIGGATRAPDGALVRLGDTLFLLAADVRPFRDGVSAEPFVAGPTLRACMTRLEQAAAAGRDVLVSGETGSGKEIAARVFHAASRRAAAPMISVNCASIPEGLAERLLFGARRGAYSGATADVAGFFGEAHGGVVFLDEVGELDVRVQAKLLRFLETREIFPLGATQGQRVDVQLCFATHRDLPAAVAQGRMREDFYFRIAKPEIVLPPLRERRHEIPWLVVRELRADDRRLTAHPRLVEACILGEWPGNVRELLHAVRGAADLAAVEGTTVVRAEHLSGVAPPRVAPRPSSAPASPSPATPSPATKEQIEAALARHGGNMVATAEALGLHRRKLYRLLALHGITRGRA